MMIFVPELSIIIVNYNSRDKLVECLNSIYRNLENVRFEVMVIDNHSRDGSPQIIKQKFPQVNLIPNDVNLGLTRAQNQGLKQAKGKYILLLNNDTLIMPLSINKLIEFLDKNPAVGICGPGIFYKNGKTQLSYARTPRNPHVFLLYLLFKNLFSWFKFKKRACGSRLPLEVDYVSGACLIIRREIMERIGLMDEGYFVYNEDDDLCLRVKQCGYKIYYLPEAKIIHYQGKGGTQCHPFRITIQIHKGIFRLYKKFYLPSNPLLDGLMTVILTLRCGLALLIKIPQATLN